MSASWVSSSARRLVVGVLLAVAMAAVPAAARVVVNGVAIDDSGGTRHSRVRVSRNGVIVTSGRADVVIGDDTLGRGPLVVDEDANGMVRFLGDAHVRRGERYDGDVVAIFGNVKIEGEINGSAVAVFGHVDVAPGASVGSDAVAVFGGQRVGGHVDGDAVAVMGSVTLAPGASVGNDAVAVGGRVDDGDRARIGGESVSVGLLPLTLGLPALPAVLASIVLGWLISVFFGWLFGMLFPERLVRVGATASRRTFLSIVLAILSLLAWPAVSILVMATIIGLPVGLLLWFAYPVLAYAGQLAGTYVLGCKLLRRRLGEGPTLAPIAAGSLLIAILFGAAAVFYPIGGAAGALALFFGLVGLLVLVGLTTIGTGAFLLSRGGTLPLDAGPTPVGSAPESAPGPVTV